MDLRVISASFLWKFLENFSNRNILMSRLCDFSFLKESQGPLRSIYTLNTRFSNKFPSLIQQNRAKPQLMSYTSNSKHFNSFTHVSILHDNFPIRTNLVFPSTQPREKVKTIFFGLNFFVCFICLQYRLIDLSVLHEILFSYNINKCFIIHKETHNNMNRNNAK